MTFDEYRASVLRTWNPDLDRIDSLLNAALGLGEAGEIQNLIKKNLFHYDKMDLRDKLVDEMGDLYYYLESLGWLIDVSTEAILIRNSQKLKARYPDGFKPGGGNR